MGDILPSRSATFDLLTGDRSWSPAPDDQRWARLLVGAMTLSFGLAGMLVIPSGQFSTGESIFVGLATLSTVPVAVAWCLGSWPSPRLAALNVLWADVGILGVLLAFESPFAAMPGCAMFAVIAVFAIVATSQQMLVLHLVFSIGALAVFAVLSVLDGIDPWLAGSRCVTLGALFVVPFAVRPYLHDLRRKAEVALRDSLTGLFNRRGLFEAVEEFNESVPDSPREDIVIGVLVIDIDGFKAINDRYGHPSGDAVLVDVANRLRGAASSDTVVARLGGDEFVCVHVGSRTDVDGIERRIRAALEETVDGPPFTASVGSAGEAATRGDTTGAQLRKLIAIADIDLYRSKVHPQALVPVHRIDPLQVRDQIDSMIAAGGPSVVFQPICDTATTEIVGYEALSRFPFGHGSPLIWFRDASQAGIGPRLELAAIDEALRAMATLPPDAFVSINASAETIRTTDLLARLSPHVCSRTLYLEITEHERVDDYRSVARSVEGLRAAGVRISVDDVGAGFSGLRQVVELKPDALKVDISLVRGIDTDPTRRAVAAALAKFAHDVGSTLIMEGVETAGELRVALELGVDMVQGFLTGRPEAPSAS
ncbi:bifunctional diguanylate cyclase/phosphodiesterase [Rhodococcoides kyotonense]|nr:bifunctional diguanylate cyclase/phosphodiesterase [Rhodococcus kyotonensis]